MNTRKQGIINAIIAYVLWGVYPLYWHLLRAISPTELVITRTFWAFVTLFIIILILRLHTSLWKTIKDLIKDKRKVFLLVLATALLSVNWLVFTFAIVSGRLLEASLGYYINPILNILIGVIFLKERLNKYQVVAAIMVFVAVLFLTIFHGIFPWISLVLALSFGCYGVVKKFIQLDSLFSLFLETTLILPISSFLFIFWLYNGTSILLQGDTFIIFLMIASGFITVLPLFFFAKAVKQLPLSIIGFLQYLGPSINMVLAIFVLGEHFSIEYFITFGIIWVACLIFSTSHWLQPRMNK